MERDTKQRLSRTIGRLNHEGNLNAPVSHSDVIEVLLKLDETIARRILRDLEESANVVENPTAYVLSRAGKSMRASSFAVGDHMSKVKRQIGWLNKHAGFKKQVSFIDVIEPLSKCEEPDALGILKSLHENAEYVDNPTGYIIKAATSKYSVVSKEFSKEISSYIGWLNFNAELQAPLIYDEVAPPLSSIDVPIALRILKDLSDNAPNIVNPTAYVIAAAARHGAANASSTTHQRQSSNKHDLWWESEAWWDAYSWKIDADGEDDNVSRLEHEVRSINKNVWLRMRLSYDVVEPLSKLEASDAQQILYDLKIGVANIENPTAYVLAAAGRAAKKCGNYDWKISRQVGWLNRHGNLLDALSYDDLAKPLSKIGLKSAMAILKNLQVKANKISNPTGWVLSEVRRVELGQFEEDAS